MIRFIKKNYNMFKDIFEDRELLVAFSIKDFKKKFAGSYLGIIWAFIQPIITIIIYWAVFQFGFKSSNIGEIPFVLWFVCGIVPWLFIADTIPSASNSFLEYSYLVKKIVFNINILPLVKIFSSFFVHLFFLLLVSILCIILGFPPTIYLFQLIYYIICTIIYLYSINLIFSSILVFFRDLNQIINLLLLIGMWTTPIAWNLTVLPTKFHAIIKINPLFYLIEGYRDSFLGEVWFWQKGWININFWLITIILFCIGSFIYNRLKPHFADAL